MAAREHSPFVHFVLPWIIAAGGLVVYLLTLNGWVSLASLPTVARVAGWDWNIAQLPPLMLLVTAPFRLLPAAWQPVALNVFSAICGGLTLGLLAKSVALLPHDRTREQRARETSEHSFLSVPLAWLPPVLAAVAAGLQLTFWEHATAQTGEMLNLLLFAYCGFCVLRFRVAREDKWLFRLAFVFAAAMANDWGMIGFAPAFLVAVAWVKGFEFFQARFLLRALAWAAAGLLFYLVVPLAMTRLVLTDASFWEVLRAQLGIQRMQMFAFPRFQILLFGLTSLLPVLLMGIRWPATFGDLSAAGASMTNLMFRLVHLAFLGACLWMAFDPPFSPRALGFGLPFLPFYYLGALSVGYFSGYLLLVFGAEPGKRWRRAGPGTRALGQGVVAALVGVAAVICGALIIRNLPAIRGQNGPLLREYVAELTASLPRDDAAVLSDEPMLLQLVAGRLGREAAGERLILLDTRSLPIHAYQRSLGARHGSRWPELILENLGEPLRDVVLLEQVYRLAASNRLFYLHPSFGYFFEPFHSQPARAVYELLPRPTNDLPTRLPPAALAANQEFWERIRREFAERPRLARLIGQRMADAQPVAMLFGRGLNTWGVALQREQKLPEAAQFFAAARRLDTNNVAASINADFNRALVQGRAEAGRFAGNINDRLGRFRSWSRFLLACGPVDEPHCLLNSGAIFARGNLRHQAADQFSRVLELQPGSLQASFGLAQVSLDSGRLDRCLDLVQAIRRQHASQLTPADHTALAKIEAWARFGRGEHDAALALLRDTPVPKDARVDVLLSLSQMHLQAGQTEQAVAAADQACQAEPDNPRPPVTKSAVLITLKRFDDARLALEPLLSRDPTNVPALVNRAIALNELGRFDDAAKDYQTLLEAAPRLASVYFNLGVLDLRRSETARARRNFRKFLQEADPDSPDAKAARQHLDDIAAGRAGK